MIQCLKMTAYINTKHLHIYKPLRNIIISTLILRKFHKYTTVISQGKTSMFYKEKFWTMSIEAYATLRRICFLWIQNTLIYKIHSTVYLHQNIYADKSDNKSIVITNWIVNKIKTNKPHDYFPKISQISIKEIHNV